MATKPNDSAFAKPNGEHELTKREYFAAMAMQGLLTRVPNRHNNETDLGILECARIKKEAVVIADALIEELNKQQENAAK